MNGTADRYRQMQEVSLKAQLRHLCGDRSDDVWQAWCEKYGDKRVLMMATLGIAIAEGTFTVFPNNTEESA
jgi:hypothetical protein